MIQYIFSFIVYTLAMVGVLVLGFVIYKKTVLQTPPKRNSVLKIVDVLRLGDRKTVYLISCKTEQFLLASSNDKITLIAKLDNKKEEVEKYLKQKAEIAPQEEKITENQIIKSLLKELSDKNQTKRGNY